MRKLLLLLPLTMLLANCGRPSYYESEQVDGGLVRLPPPSDVVGAWRLDEPVTQLDAEGVRGLEQRVRAVYTLRTGPEANVEVRASEFDQDDAAAAYHLRNRPVGLPSLPIGADAWWQASDDEQQVPRLRVWKGLYTMTLTPAGPQPMQRQAAVFLAQRLTERIPGPNVPSGVIGVLPSNGRRIPESQWPSIAYRLEPVAPGDQSAAPETRVTVSAYDDDFDADERLATLRKNVGPSVRDLAGYGDKAFIAAREEVTTIGFRVDSALVQIDSRAPEPALLRFARRVRDRLDSPPSPPVSLKEVMALDRENRESLGQDLRDRLPGAGP